MDFQNLFRNRCEHLLKFLRNHWPTLAIISSILCVYGRSVFFPLLWWDDRINLCQNVDLNPIVSGSSLLHIWQHSYFALYIPVTYTVWGLLEWLNQWSGGSCLEGSLLFHSLSIALHICNTVLVYKLLRLLQPTQKTVVIFLAALVFAFHPIQVESVAWISSSRDLLATFFGLYSLFLFLNGRTYSSFTFFILALFSKPNAVVFAPLALLLSLNQGRKLKIQEWLWGAFSGFAGLATIFLNKNLQNDSLLHFKVSFWERPLVFSQAVGFYLEKFFWPFDLVPDYARSIIALQKDPTLLWLGMGLPLLFVIAFLFRRTLFAPTLWLLIALLPFSGLVSFGFQETSTVADHYFYLPLFAMSWAVTRHSFAPKYEALLLKAGSLLILFLALLTFWQIHYWQNDELLFAHNAQVAPSSSIANINLGNSYLHQQLYPQAEQEFKLAVKNHPQNGEGWLGLGLTYDETGRTDQAQHIYQQAVDSGWAVAKIYNNLGVISFHRNEFAKAEAYWLGALEKDPAYMESLYNLGILFSGQNRKAEALKYFERAAEVDPHNSLILDQIKILQRN